MNETEEIDERFPDSLPRVLFSVIRVFPKFLVKNVLLNFCGPKSGNAQAQSIGEDKENTIHE